MLKQFFQGICMALADSVPGVSGGTIAFILGFYDRFIGSIHDVIYERGEQQMQGVRYLLKLGLGWATGMVAAILVLTSVFESHIYMVSSLFLGFVIASIPVIIREEKEMFLDHKENIIFFVCGLVVAVGITLFQQTSIFQGISLNQLSIPMMLYVFVTGMIAISAMFLPGISGSTLLLIFGLYLPVLSAVKELLHFHFDYFPGVCIFGVGVLTGILSVVKGIKKCLDLHRSKTMYAILGLMTGSIWAIIQGPAGIQQGAAALSLKNFGYPAFFAGIVLVAALQAIGKKSRTSGGI